MENNKNLKDNNIYNDMKKANYEITKEFLNFRNNYSKDDILRNSEKLNLNNKEDRNNINNIKDENIFNQIIKDKENDEVTNKENEDNKYNKNSTIGKTLANNNKTINYNSVENNYKYQNEMININRNKLNNNHFSTNTNEKKMKINNNPNINIKKIIKYKEKKVTPKYKELCHKFTDNPQHFFTIQLNKFMLKALNLKKNMKLDKKNN